MSKASGPLCTIIVVNYNGGRLLWECVESIYHFTKDFELLVIDNGSSDASLNLLDNNNSRTTVIRNGANLGFAKANNIGIGAARGKYIVLLNSDTVVTPGWLDTLVACAEADSDIGIVTPKLVRSDGRLDSTGHSFSLEPYIITDRGQGEPDLGQYDSLTELISASFACVLLRKKIFTNIGLLDEKMFFYFEDVDFCVRAKIAGWRVVYAPSSRIYHVRGGSTSQSATKNLQRSSAPYSLRIVLKSCEPWPVLRYAKRILWNVLESIKYRRADLLFERLVIILWNLWNLPLRERIQAQSSRKVNDRDAFRLPSGRHS
jgi:GT2 family glycosyltransferase